MNKTVVKRLKSYKELKADIVYINIQIQELNDEYGIGAQQYTERVQSSSTTSTVERQAEVKMKKEEELLKEKAFKEREILRIDNALTVLNDIERDIIETLYINSGRIASLELKYERTYARIKQIETDAFRKIEKYLS